MIAETGLETVPRYAMTLFVTGASRLSLQAVSRVREFCEEELTGNYDLEVVDLYRSPERAKEAQVIASPTLLRDNPAPVRRVIGDMSDRGRLRAAIKVVLSMHDIDGSSDIADLKSRLAEAEDTLRALRSGEVDALVVDGKSGAQVFTLKSAAEPYRLLVEQMREGAINPVA